MSIKVENIEYKYMVGSPFEKKALDNVNFEINTGEFVGIIGHTGSGKSTLMQLFNALLKPSAGNIYIDDVCITSKDADLKKLRQKVGLVFQYPEHQLFEETVYKDVSFGPLNLGLTAEEADKRVKRALTTVNIPFDKYKDISPFDLSGGQKRRVAIAGVLAMEPEILILDEPTAGLDPMGREEILREIKRLKNEYKMTVLLVSHSMEEVAKVADKIVVMYKGKNILCGPPKEVFLKTDELERVGLAAPQVTYLMKRLREKGLEIREDVTTIGEAKDELLKLLGGGK